MINGAEGASGVYENTEEKKWLRRNFGAVRYRLMNTKQQQLLYDKGITNVPSDILCSDNALEESIGMIYDDGEHRVIQKPKVYINTGRYDGSTSGAPVILYIHKFEGARFIGYRKTNNQLIWGIKDGATFVKGAGDFGLTYTSNTQITSVGKTLIISDTNGMHYFLWKPSGYENLGNIPEIDIDFRLEKADDVHSTVSTDGIILESGKYLQEPPVKNQEDYNNAIVGLYSKNLKSVARNKAFCRPFFVRAALKMYDESYFMMTNPVLMFPSVRNNSYSLYQWRSNQVEMRTECKSLFFSQKTDYSKWSDIIKEIVLFVSDEANIHDTNSDQDFNTLRLYGSTVYIDGVFSQVHNAQHASYYHNTPHQVWVVDADNEPVRQSFQPLISESDQQIILNLKSISVFYKLCSVGTETLTNKNIAEYTDKYVLENITTQEQLPEDDYFSHCPLYPSFLYSYNSRLNIANVSRGFFDGFHNFEVWDNSGSSVYNIYVTIMTDEGEVVVHHQTPSIYQKMGQYFYYPDSRATNVVIYNGGSKILDAKLTEHNGLNGAYYIAGLPGDTEPVPDTSAGGRTDTTSSPRERLPNYIIQSEVNNPWLFKAEGYHKVGVGEIMAMSSITQAISQGQFGQYPLLVFSSDGIWAMSVANSGYYTSIHPMSREVCNNVKSITQTDGAVFFSSEKGLMLIVGNDVKCMSGQLNGREANFSGEVSMGNFHDYLLNSVIAYDYRDSLLWIFNNRYYCYVYSIKSGTFGKFRFDSEYAIENVVNNYPDFLIQDVFGNTRSLLTRENINNDETIYSGLMITRPMKFENGLALKTIMDLKNLRQMEGTMQLRIFASNNLDNWFEISSLGGIPWKYYRFRFDLSDMKATDRFAGTVIITQERRTDKLR